MGKKEFNAGVVEFSFSDVLYSETIEGNIELSELTPKDIQKALSKAIGKHTFYNNILAEVKRLQSKLESDYDLWHTRKYSEADAEDPKKTESYKKSQVMLKNEDEFISYNDKLRKADHIINKIKVLVTAYENQIRVLQSIAALQRAEIASGFMGKGGGDISNVDFE